MMKQKQPADFPRISNFSIGITINFSHSKPMQFYRFFAEKAGEVCNIFAVHINEMDWNAMYHCSWTTEKQRENGSLIG
jgi:hypothetical protein